MFEVTDDDADDPGHPAYWQKFLGEAASPFEHEPSAPPSIETLRQLYSSVLASYDFTCCMTGQRFKPPQDFLHEQLQLAAIKPLTMGGALHVSNFLCLDTAAAEAFRQGHISVGPGGQLVVDLTRMDPELLERIVPLGRLRQPSSEIAQPDPRALAFHFGTIFLHG